MDFILLRVEKRLSHIISQVTFLSIEDVNFAEKMSCAPLWQVFSKVIAIIFNIITLSEDVCIFDALASYFFQSFYPTND